MKVIIGGDLVPTSTNYDLFEDEDSKKLLGEELYSLWNSVEMRIFNLEVPLTDQNTPIQKCGPNLKTPTRTIKGIKKLNPSLITLANNHILDQGINGLNSTTALLESEKIPFIGAGKNISDASKPYIFRKNGISVGFYTCAENEFTIATERNPGANPFDPLESLDHINKLKSECDYVVVLYHGGKEHYRYPSPYLQKVCRKIVEKGADVVICQHSHCVGSFEEYNNSTIIYGQGNFIFNKYDNEYWRTSILVYLNIGESVNVSYVPIITDNNSIRLANARESHDILAAFNNRSKELLQEGVIESKYEQFANEKIESYLRALSGVGKWTSRIDRKIMNGRLMKRKYSKSRLLAIQNFIECEAHRELLLKGLKGFRGDNLSGR
ncbi:CapA family protein [Paenibacillus gallinarum]|uniref:CapA family protein n=1 Tax=Paenibacillus gallinarum TaxID=2762232 RepID=A0ABR8T4Q1_9BACL|nr:CapA family protein [Paenibacillus gallinarum]MBD7970575.1 CapA family protein [Paenibacillus gallinarum]